MEIELNKKLHLAVDFDRTLAYRDDNDLNIDRVGCPILPMIQKVRVWLSKGHQVTIFTARVGHENFEQDEKQRQLISVWLDANGLPQLPITAIKKNYFDYFIDDKAIPVTENLGIIEKIIKFN